MAVEQAFDGQGELSPLWMTPSACSCPSAVASFIATARRAASGGRFSRNHSEIDSPPQSCRHTLSSSAASSGSPQRLASDSHEAARMRQLCRRRSCAVADCTVRTAAETRSAGARSGALVPDTSSDSRRPPGGVATHLFEDHRISLLRRLVGTVAQASAAHYNTSFV